MSGGGVLLAAGGDSGTAAAVAIAVVTAVVVLAMLAGLWRLARLMRLLRRTVDELRAESAALLQELQGTVGRAGNELERADRLLVTAETVSTRVDSASRLAVEAFSNPVIKVMAFKAGTARAARRLRRKSGD